MRQHACGKARWTKRFAACVSARWHPKAFIFFPGNCQHRKSHLQIFMVYWLLFNLGHWPTSRRIFFIHCTATTCESNYSFRSMASTHVDSSCGIWYVCCQWRQATFLFMVDGFFLWQSRLKQPIVYNCRMYRCIGYEELNCVELNFSGQWLDAGHCLHMGKAATYNYWDNIKYWWFGLSDSELHCCSCNVDLIYLICPSRIVSCCYLKVVLRNLETVLFCVYFYARVYSCFSLT